MLFRSSEQKAAADRQAAALMAEKDRQDRLITQVRTRVAELNVTFDALLRTEQTADRELTDLQHWIRALWRIASRLRQDRMAHGSLDLDMPETKIFVDEKGYADRLEKIEHDESHQLIEEFMLAANEAVARLTRTRRLPSLYRVHDEPDIDRLEEFHQLLESFEKIGRAHV